jgi:ubiquinone biosynthesis protein COQ4
VGPTYAQLAPRRALRAARTLVADPDDLPQVFTIIESLSGNTLHRIWKRMSKTERGRRILSERPDIVTLLENRAALAQLPEGSLGRAYLAFVEREKISPAGIRAAGKKGMTNEIPLSDPYDYVYGRMRDTHDLWHTVVGYHGDVLGETALLAFTFAQTRNPAIALIIGIGLLKTIGAPAARAVILDGHRRGRAAAWMPEQEWEAMLALPLSEVRSRLHLEAPPVYTQVRSADLKAQRPMA